MIAHQQTTHYQDAVNLLIKVQMVNDVIAYNSTLSLGDKYRQWVDRHQEHVFELVQMLEKDIALIENPKMEKIISLVVPNYEASS